MAVKATEDQVIYQYTPRSDIFMSIDDFPHIIIEISSDKYKGRDRYRMLLQASCLVRLGNRLLPDKSSTFFVKVFYINHDYHADEYTLYQKGSRLIDDEVCFQICLFSQEEGVRRTDTRVRSSVTRNPTSFLRNATCSSSYSTSTTYFSRQPICTRGSRLSWATYCRPF